MSIVLLVSVTSFRERAARGPVLHQEPSRFRTMLWATYGLLGVLLFGYLVSLIVRPDNAYWPWVDGGLLCGVELVACGLCLARGLVRRPGRTAALVLGFALLSWTFGDIVLNL